ncbi:hypothetical protein ABTF26_21755, partial [Acinetobacter baumannii]
TLGRALAGGRQAVAEVLAASAEASARRRSSAKIHDPAVAARLAVVTPAMANRTQPFAERQKLQQAHFALPAFPTTTIG